MTESISYPKLTKLYHQRLGIIPGVSDIITLHFP
ncbi:hypothetical protein AGR1A_pAt20175 [Agrobacterium fabacearum CFBP 5771]|nr:hypothetical protein AGR1A_pAt20175 [Agrobacterium fabacearum CFBP 5771]